MLLKLICTVFIINTYITLSNSVQISEFNETSAFLLINSQLTELRAELERQGKFHPGSIQSGNPRSLKSYGSNCAEATVNSKTSGIYEILIPSYSKHHFKVACDATTEGGRWTVILSRMDGSVNFYRNWYTYKKGFGDLDGEFFLGLDKIHALTAEYSQELLVVLEDFDGTKKFERYEKFGIADEDEQYALHTLGQASGTAGDSFSFHHTRKFSTFDRNNDPNNANVAKQYAGAWWYNNGHHNNLAGTYNATTGFKGLHWYTFYHREVTLKKAVMMIRPRM